MRWLIQITGGAGQQWKGRGELTDDVGKALATVLYGKVTCFPISESKGKKEKKMEFF